MLGSTASVVAWSSSWWCALAAPTGAPSTMRPVAPLEPGAVAPSGPSTLVQLGLIVMVTAAVGLPPMLLLYFTRRRR